MHLLVKFFKEEAHAESFMRGSLYMNSLGYFKGLESSEVALRADRHEAVSHWWQPRDIGRITLSGPPIGEVNLPIEDLAGPVSFGEARFDLLRLFCMTAIYTIGGNVTSQGGRLVEEVPSKPPLEEVFRIDERLHEFGEHAVVIAPRPFFGTVIEDLKASGYRPVYGLVEYYDPLTFSGEIPQRAVPFRKQSLFSYQNEMRICMLPKLVAAGPLRFQTRDLQSMCKKVRTEEVNRLIAVTKD